ncbi:hypothetical protein ACFYY9_18810 [Streptomyces nigra]|uniref:hypothetical protein n=1 Tax=Streptomyces TaxID=1883 RepID=UPI0006E2879E|nr:hypothetical protein [Streptomyces sp. JHA19]
MAGLTAASAALVLGVANTAVAADHTMHTGDAWGDVPGVSWSGEGYFNEYGDVVTICDTDEDGHAVRMDVRLDSTSGPRQYAFYVGGNGNCATKKASMGGAYNLPENRNIGFRFCRWKNNVDESECNGYKFLNDH